MLSWWHWKQTKVSIGTIYHYFGNKEAIAKALFSHIESSMNDVITNIMATHTTAHDRCKAVITYLFDITARQPDAVHFMLYAKHQEFMPDEKPVCSSRPFTLMKNIVVQGINDCTIRNIDPNVAAVTIFGGAIRLIFLHLDNALENPIQTYLEDCWDCAWRGVAS